LNSKKDPYAKSYSNNFFRKDTVPKIISGLNNNNNYNNKVINFDAEKKLLNINCIDESYENKKDNNIIYNNYNNFYSNNGRLSPSKTNSKSKFTLFANSPKSKDKKVSNFNLYKESQSAAIKLTEADNTNTNNNSNNGILNKKEKEIFHNENINKLKSSSSPLNNNNKYNNNNKNIASKSAVDFYNAESKKKSSLDEKLINPNNNNNTRNNTNNLGSPKSSSFKVKKSAADAENINLNKSEYNEKIETNKFSP